MKECVILVNNEKSFWYQELDFKTAFLLSKSRSFKKTAQRPELTQIIAATKLPEVQINSHVTNEVHRHESLYIGAKQHIDSDWILLYDAHIAPSPQVIESLKKNMKSLNIESLKILADTPEAATTEKTLESGLKSSFPTAQLVYWPQ